MHKRFIIAVLAKKITKKYLKQTYGIIKDFKTRKKPEKQTKITPNQIIKIAALQPSVRQPKLTPKTFPIRLAI